VDGVLERLRATPGVRAAAASFTAPLAGAPNRGINIEGDMSRRLAHADFRSSPDYFKALGMTLFAAGLQRRRPPTHRSWSFNQAFADRYLGAIRSGARCSSAAARGTRSSAS
jgi:hypothetical protein